MLYKTVKTEKKDAYVVGEVWEDATNKEGFGKRRRYLQGAQMDGVMNYVLKDAVIDFITSKNARRLSDAITLLKENYPKPSLGCLMNILGSHDTKRILSVLGGVKTDDCDYEGQAAEKLSPEEKEIAISRLKTAWFLLTVLPGMPTVYYGDEAGLEGLRDPLNRKFFPWGKENTEILAHYRTMGKIRRENPCLAESDVEPFLADGPVFAVARGELIAICNVGASPEKIVTDRDFTDIISGTKIKKGEFSLPPLSYFLLK